MGYTISPARVMTTCSIVVHHECLLNTQHPRFLLGSGYIDILCLECTRGDSVLRRQCLRTLCVGCEAVRHIVAAFSMRVVASSIPLVALSMRTNTRCRGLVALSMGTIASSHSPVASSHSLLSRRLYRRANGKRVFSDIRL